VLPLPKDAPIVDDALNALLVGQAVVGAAKSFYVLDPLTATFVKNTVSLKGKQPLTIDGLTIQATLVEVAEPRMVMKVFLSEKGDLIKADSIAGIEMRPITKEEADKVATTTVKTDLAEATRIRVTPPLDDMRAYKSITYRFSKGDFSRAPADASQAIRAESGATVVTVTPVAPNPAVKTTIAQAAKQKPEWIKPGLNITCADPTLKKLAKQVVGSETNVVRAAQKIGKHVNGIMRPNAGIGVLRNAKEVLETKEGVCRDYAILTATLLRSANIPARLASGLVYQDSSFYYHAWVEVWDGSKWFGVDSTRSGLDVTAGHIKLAHGSVEDAFLFTFLDKAEVTVVKKVSKAGRV
jgi:hypothetical protein